MKKYMLLYFLCFCLSGLSHAQLYLKGYTGYALSTGNLKLTSTEIINNDKYESSYRMKLGQGLNLGFSMGYALNKNVAFEITGNTQLLSTFAYSPYQWDYNDEYDYTYGISIYQEGFFDDFEYTNTMFQVSPQIVFKSNPYNQWAFYLKGGPDFFFAAHKRTTHDDSSLRTVRLTGNVSTGIQCSFGAEYKLSKYICAFAELTTVNVNYTFKRAKTLRYEIDGVDSLSTLESTESNDLDKKEVFNHIGLNIGVKYIFK